MQQRRLRKHEIKDPKLSHEEYQHYSLQNDLTIVAQCLHHDLCLCKLIGEANFTGHFAGRVSVCIQLLTAAAVLHHTNFSILILCTP